MATRSGRSSCPKRSDYHAHPSVPLARNRIFTPGGGLAFAGHPTLGTAAAPLGAYRHWHGLMPAGSPSFWYEQGIEMQRPSRLWVEVGETGGHLQVKVGGQVRIVGKGEFQL